MMAVEAILGKSANVTTRRSASNESANVTMEGTKTTMSRFIQPQETWIIDSGASSHMCKDVERFENLKPATGSIGGADGRAIVITGEGRVRILTKDSTGDNQTLVLERVLLIPSLEYNLFSICAITEKGHWNVFEEHGGFIKINGEPLKVNFGREGNLFALHCGEEKGLKTGTRNEEATLETWHRRMGHQGAETIKKLEATVNGMKITDLSHTKCEVCSETKMAKKPFTSSTTRVSKPLQLIHSDVAGPMRTATAEEGHRYVINFIDDYS